MTHNGITLNRELDDNDVPQLRQRRLSQPFAWHQDSENSISKNEDSNHLSAESDPAEGTTQEKPKEGNSSDVKPLSPSTCRNSVQGQIYIADDRG